MAPKKMVLEYDDTSEELFEGSLFRDSYQGLFKDEDDERLVVIDKFHRHEVIDRISCIMETIEKQIVQHLFCEVHYDLQKRLNKALKHLAKAYQEASAIKVTGE